MSRAFFLRSKFVVITVSLLAAALWMPFASADVIAVDDEGHAIKLAQPAKRIVSLAPHATELLFAIGAGDRIVGAVEFSDYPEAAKKIPRVGGYKSVDIERVRTLAPDLVVGWASGNADKQIEKLRALGIPVYVDEPHVIHDVVVSMQKLSRLTGNEAQANIAADRLHKRFSQLQTMYAERAPVRLFYQVWEKPLMTVGGKQIVSDAMRVCGAVNVFANLSTLAPVVDVESVLAANPEMIATSGHRGEKLLWLDAWKKWPHLQAVEKQNLVVLPPDLLNRLGPRIIDGTEKLCEEVDVVRKKRG